MGEYRPSQTMTQAPSLHDLNGVWVLDKHLSANIPSILKLQRLPFLLRKAITSPSTPIHLHVTTYTTANPNGETKIHLDLIQRTPGLGLGLVPVIEDKRVLDWVEGWHEDLVFGKVRTRSRLVSGVKGNDKGGRKGRMRPDVGVCVSVKKEVEEGVGIFLRGERGIDDDGVLGGDVSKDEIDGEDGQFWVQTLEINDKAGWSAETIWGFEMVDSARCLTSRVVAVDGKGNYQLGRCVFRLLSRGD
ncbi:hypothetical protein BJY04DRAFT_74948 [Aspergillus karnatakaensis]|uniref:uncharacterized protein n=1 Tax=Aspergillus karnatakaensis TaxID=1810916 RepID=UPI003CCDD83D